MALRHALLAALGDDESSGYDLAKSFDVGVANFWNATPQQIYRELDRMQSDGLLSARVLEQQRRPNKRLFSVTDLGREAMQQFVREAPKSAAMRDELMVQVEMLDRVDIAPLREHIEQHLEVSSAKLTRYLESQKAVLAGRDEQHYFATAKRIGPYLTLKRGIIFEESNVAWCELALGALRVRAGSRDNDASTG